MRVPRIVFALVLALAGARAGAAADPPGASAGAADTFAQACRAYEQGKWDEAADSFRGLLRYGYADPRLEYNLANAEYKRGHVGEAILHYERARRLDPADPDIATNLALARSRIRDVVEDPNASGPLAAWHGFQDRVGAGAQAIAALAAFWIVAGIVAWCGSRPGGFTPAWGWAIAAGVAATIVLTLSWRATWMRLAGTPQAVILKPAVEALVGPDLNNTVIFTLHEGTTVDVRGERPGWVQVALPNGLTGWVVRDAAERI